MKKLTITGAFLAIVLFLPPSMAAPKAGKKGGPKNKPIPGTPQEYTQLSKLREVSGRLASVGSSTNMLTLDIDYQYPVPNRNANRRGNPRYRGSYHTAGIRGGVNVAGLQQRWVRLVGQQEQAMMIRNPVQRVRRLQQTAVEMEQLQAQLMMSQVRAVANAERMQMRVINNQQRALAAAMRNPPYKLAGGTKQFELQATDKIVVRRLSLPFEYDDKGFPKKYTAAEVKAARGNDSSLPGYTARYEDLQPGQLVKMYLAKPQAKLVVAEKDEPARPAVRMVLILADAPR